MPPHAAGDAFALAAATMIGRRFRLYGRNPQTGLDCVGLVAASLAAIGQNASLPSRYSLRNSMTAHWEEYFVRSGFEPAGGKFFAGDLIVVRPAALQLHLMIAETPRSSIHAHAGLRRVVRQPFQPDIPIAAHWRLSNAN